MWLRTADRLVNINTGSTIYIGARLNPPLSVDLVFSCPGQAVQNLEVERQTDKDNTVQMKQINDVFEALAAELAERKELYVIANNFVQRAI